MQQALPEGKRDWQEIEGALDRAEKINPRSLQNQILRAELLACQHRLGEAADLLEKACRAFPYEPATWASLADLEFRRGRPNMAFDVLSRAGRDLGNPLDLRLAWARYWTAVGGNIGSQALVVLVQGAGQLPDDPAKLLQREVAEDLLRLGTVASAKLLWEEIARDCSTDLHSRFFLLELGLQSGRSEVTKGIISDLRRIEGSDGIQWRYGEAALLLARARQGPRKDISQARKLLSEIKSRVGSWSRIALLEAVGREIERDHDAALLHYLQAMAQGEDRPQVILRAVELLFQRRRYDEADQILAEAEAQGPFGPELARRGAEVALKRHDADRALRLASKAVPTNSRDYRDHLWRARILTEAGRPKAAEHALRQAVHGGAANPEPWQALVRHLVGQGRTAEAQAVLEEMRRQLPPERAQLALALCEEALGRTTQAETLVLAVVKDRPDDFLVLQAAAEFYVRTGRPSHAASLWRRLLDPAIRAPAEVAARARRQMARFLGQDARSEALAEAISLLDQNLALTGRCPEDEMARAEVLATRPSRRQEALEILEKGRHQQFLPPKSLFLLVKLYDAEGQPARARDPMLELLNQDGQNPEYLAHFVQRLLEQRRLAEAQFYLERLEQLEPPSPRTRELRLLLQKAQPRN
jgi:tetratricopeptide (TPR) repeat protein